MILVHLCYIEYLTTGYFPTNGQSRYIPQPQLPETPPNDIFWSWTGCYRPSPCLKWASSCSPRFLTLATDRCGALPGGAGRGVYSDQLRSEQDIWSEHCQNPLQSSRQPKTTCATAHQSETGLNASDATRGISAWGERVFKGRMKESFQMMFSFTLSQCSWAIGRTGIRFFNKYIPVYPDLKWQDFRAT